MQNRSTLTEWFGRLLLEAVDRNLVETPNVLKTMRHRMPTAVGPEEVPPNYACPCL
jgi:hypothetical protein